MAYLDSEIVPKIDFHQHEDKAHTLAHQFRNNRNVAVPLVPYMFEQDKEEESKETIVLTLPSSNSTIPTTDSNLSDANYIEV